LGSEFDGRREIRNCPPWDPAAVETDVEVGEGSKGRVIEVSFGRHAGAAASDSFAPGDRVFVTGAGGVFLEVGVVASADKQRIELEEDAPCALREGQFLHAANRALDMFGLPPPGPEEDIALALGPPPPQRTLLDMAE
jgi:hypothetical protein